MFHPKKREMRENGRRGRGREDRIEGTEEIDRGRTDSRKASRQLRRS